MNGGTFFLWDSWIRKFFPFSDPFFRGFLERELVDEKKIPKTFMKWRFTISFVLGNFHLLMKWS